VLEPRQQCHQRLDDVVTVVEPLALQAAQHYLKFSRAHPVAQLITPSDKSLHHSDLKDHHAFGSRP
jgi:hypothetical protein